MVDRALALRYQALSLTTFFVPLAARSSLVVVPSTRLKIRVSVVQFRPWAPPKSQ